MAKPYERRAYAKGQYMAGRAPTTGVSVVIPTFQAGRYLRECLAALESQTYDGEMEILVIDGGSTDETLSIVQSAAARGLPVRLIVNPQQRTAVGLNRGVRAARHNLIVRCDAQSRFPRNAVERLVAEHTRATNLNVGGRQVAVAPSDKAPFGAAVAATYNTNVGSGGASYRTDASGGDVDTVYLGSWRREELIGVGGFDPWFHPNEDAELNVRWRRAGNIVRLLPNLAIGYVARETVGALARQYYRYGRARARTVLRHREILPRQIAALAPLCTVLLLFLVGWSSLAALPAAAYGAALAVAAIRSRTRPAARALVPVALTTMHLAWGGGFIIGTLDMLVVQRFHVHRERVETSDLQASPPT